MVENIKHHVLIHHHPLLLVRFLYGYWCGNKIPTTLNEVLIDYLRGDGSLQESIDKPRFL